MFSSGSLGRNSTDLSENGFKGRNKLRAPLSIKKKQNIRIQLAVHRYNNSVSNSSTGDRNDLGSPFKHSVAKNSSFKSLEGCVEEESSNSMRKHNQYHGVGNFPVVHLKKNSFSRKPIKRTTNGEFKIQLPELPINRYFNHTPDMGLNTKSSTRSVLDVLQDLSRKRIHSQNDSDTNTTSKGLGGDSPLDVEAPYKPLFVTKTKNLSVTTRDSTTQTQETPSVDTAEHKSKETIRSQESSDPKAELRRKLARKNNEIFASLSSSTLSYAVKRKLGIPRDDSNDQLFKKTKYSSEFDSQGKVSENGTSSLNSTYVLKSRNAHDHAPKIEKKTKMSDSNKISPNKDRLTAIFLEMQNTKSKAERMKSQNLSEKDETPIKGVSSKAPDENGEDAKACLSSENPKPSCNAETPQVQPDRAKTETESKVVTSSKSESTNIQEKAAKDIQSGIGVTASSSTVTTQDITTSTLNINSTAPSPFPTFKMPVASTVSSSVSQAPIFSTGVWNKGSSFSVGSESAKAVNSSKDEGTVKAASQPDTKLETQKSAESSLGVHDQKKVEIGGFQFGIKPPENQTPENSSSPDVAAKIESGIPEKSNVTTTSSESSADSSKPTPSPVLSFSSQPANSGFSFGDKSVTGDIPQGFGFNFNSSSQSTTFGGFGKLSEFGKQTDKPTDDPSKGKSDSDGKATTVASTANTFTPSSFSLAPSSSGFTPSLEQKNVTPFKFGVSSGSNSITSSVKPITQTSNSLTLSNDKPSTGVFTFGQKSSEATSGSSQSVTQAAPFQQSIFTFGDKSSTPKLSTASPFTQNTQPQFQQNSGIQPSTAVTSSATTPAFGLTTQPQFQKSGIQPSTAVTASTTAFTLAAQPSSTISQNANPVASIIPTAASTTTAGLTTFSNTFSQNKVNIPTFGQSSTSFGSTTGFSGSNIFGANPSQNNVFGVNSSAQASPFSQSFGDKPQPTFGQSSNFFMQQQQQQQQPVSQASGFGQAPAFGSTTFGQAPASDNNIFGQKPQLGGFNQSGNVQQSPFGQPSTTFGSPAPFSFATPTTTSASGFSMNPASKSSVFTFGSSDKATPQPSTSFGFGGGSSATPQTSQTPFTFNSQPSNTLTFPSPASKDSSSFSAGSSGGFSFGFSSTPGSAEAPKPAAPVFNFGSSQPSSSNSGFNFGSTPPTSVFSFGSSDSSAGSNSKFMFNATQPSPGIFTPGATPSPSTSVPLQGVFNIGSGSTQPRSRSSATRARRRT